MKKILGFVLLSVSLAGCSFSESDTKSDSKQTSETASSTSTVVTAEGSEEIARTEQTEQSATASNKSLTAFEEYTILDENIDLSVLKEKVLTDNPGKRVIMFLDDNGQELYKSIYVKETNFLKIVDIRNNEGVIFDGQIS
jgi:hypothetical protein